MVPTTRVCVITGASSGIGAELARQLGSTGNYSLVLAARRKPELDAVAASLSCPVVTFVADCTRRDEVEKLAATAAQSFGGRLDVWVNNVGRGITKSVLDLTDEDVDSMMRVNVVSALYGMQAACKVFKAQRTGHLLNVSSFLGKVPAAPHRSMYSASKAALTSLTSNLRMDLLALGLDDIHVTTIFPGLVFTEFADNALHGTAGWKPPSGGGGGAFAGQTAAEAVAPMVSAIEAGRLGAAVPEEVFTQGEEQKKGTLSYASDVGAYERRLGEGMRKAAEVK